MKIAFSILILFISSNVQASGQTDLGAISNLYVNSGWTMVNVPEFVGSANQAKNNPDGCEDNGYYAINPSDPSYQTMHSTLMAAQFANKKVKFWVSGCSGQNGNHPKIVSIWVYN